MGTLAGLAEGSCGDADDLGDAAVDGGMVEIDEMGVDIA